MQLAKMAVTRDDIVHTAIQLLNEVGLDGLTLRRLATELGISAPTLYWHVRDKRSLLDLMAEAMIHDFRATLPPMPEGLDWWEKIAEGMRRQYQALIHYRDGARVVAGNRPTDTALPEIESFLKLWVEAGFSPSEALASVLSFGDFVAGSALEYQAEVERRKEQGSDALALYWEKMRDYPTLRAAAEGRVAAMQGKARTAFDHGLDLFISGLRVRHAELMAEKAKSVPKDAA
ncbi:MAG: TetR/AcrR family transcriptional regulator C-terminal domain-containing protein [Devosia sp.]